MRIGRRRKGMTDVVAVERRRLVAVVEDVVGVDQLVVRIEHLTAHRRHLGEQEQEKDRRRFSKRRRNAAAADVVPLHLSDSTTTRKRLFVFNDRLFIAVTRQFVR